MSAGAALPEALLERCLRGKLQRRSPHGCWSSLLNLPELLLREPTYHNLLEIDEDVSVVMYVSETLRMLQKVISVADGSFSLYYDWYSMSLDTKKKDVISRIYVGSTEVLLPRKKPHYEVYQYHAFCLY